MATIGLGGDISRTGLVSKLKQRPGELRQPQLRRSKAGKQLIPDWLVSAWCFLCQRQMENQLIDCWPHYSARNKRPGLGEYSGGMSGFGGHGSRDIKNPPALPSEKDCLRKSRANLSFLHHTVACREVESSRWYSLRHGSVPFKYFSHAELVFLGVTVCWGL